MASLGMSFNAENVAPAAPRELLPPGKYPAHIVQSEMKPTSTGGQMLVLEMEVTDGPSAGRRLWDRLNLVNNNSTAVEIAQRTLSSICHATGKMQVLDSDELHFLPMLITVKVQPPRTVGDKTYEASNGVAGYEPAARQAARGPVTPATIAPRPAPAPVAQPVPANAAGKPAPWARKAG